MTAAALKLGPSFTVPATAVTQTFGLVGKRGVGKTHGAGVIAEELLEHGMQVVVLDPIGVWWGLRSSADGKSEGYGVLVLGGEHGDLPLDPNAGKLVADFVVSKAASVVIDLGEMSKTSQRTFVSDFLEQLYRKNRAPLHLILDEADEFAPQRLNPGTQRCFGAVDTVVRRGRARGLGVTLVTQRSAAINKDVLTQIEVLVAFRTIAPQDRSAIEAWIEVHAEDPAVVRNVMTTLPKLEVGEAWLWSPSWLEDLVRVKFRRRRTFDSSATPEVGKAARAPKKLAAVDVAAFRGELSALVTKAEQEDPRLLRRQVAELQGKLAAAGRAVPVAPPAKIQRVEVPVVSEAKLERLAKELAQLGGKVDLAQQTLATWMALQRSKPIDARLFEGYKYAEQDATRGEITRKIIERIAHRSAPGAEPPTTSVRRTPPNGDAIGGGERKILTAIAQHGQVTREQLSVLTGYKRSSRDTYLQRLRAAGYIEAGGDLIEPSDAGLAVLGEFDPLPTGRALRDHWLANLPEGEGKILDLVAQKWPEAVDRDSISDATGYKRSSRDTYLQRLSARRLIEAVGRGAVRASGTLFDGHA